MCGERIGAIAIDVHGETWWMAHRMRIEIGQTLGRYRLVAPLGHGAMGEVYRARDTVLLRDVALKILQAEAGDADGATVNPTASDAADAGILNSPHAASVPPARRSAVDVSPILREARAAAALDHPNAVAVFEVGEWEGVAFLAMELIEGATLRRRLEDPVGVAEADARRWLVAIAEALAAAHRRGIVHRDIKPENVMVREDGVVKVLDFGIARHTRPRDVDGGLAALDAGTLRTITGEWSAAGTPHYMPPEQLRGERLDGRADQFAWGVVAYELLAGRRPWSGAGAIETVSSMLHDEPAPMGEGVTPALAAVIRRTLAREREARFASMDELLEALRTLPRASALASAVPASDAPAPRPSWLGRAAVGASFLVMVSALVGAVRAPVARRSRLSPPRIAVAAPVSRKAEAAEAYALGVTSFRDASFRPARVALDRAAALDPSLAAAVHLRRALLQPIPDTALRMHIQGALELRSSLSEEDAALLGGLTPWGGVPADFAESERRLVAAAARFPRSTDILYLLGRTRFERVAYRSALEAFDAAIAIDPTFAAAIYLRSGTLRRLDDVAGVEESLARCFAVSPASTSCLRDTIDLAENLGRCDSVVALSRRLIALDPAASPPYRHLAQGLLATGASRASVADALEHAWARLPDDERLAARLADSASLHALYGELAEAERDARAWEDAVAARPDEWDHVPTYRLRWLIATERGRTAEVAALADAYLHRYLGWAPDDFRLRSDIYAIQAKYRAGVMPREAFKAARNAWLTRQRDSEPDHTLGGISWIVAYAQPATTRDDAREALSVLPIYMPLPSVIDRGVSAEEPIGETHLLAGDDAEALASLRVAAASCETLDYPFQQTRASYALGLALERTGDVAGACAAFDVVRRRWGQSESRTARAAKARRARLDCPAEGTAGPVE